MQVHESAPLREPKLSVPKKGAGRPEWTACIFQLRGDQRHLGL